MTNKELYKELCEKEKSIPIFSRDWWMNAVCEEDKWDVILIEKGGQIIATLPYYINNKEINQPVLTQKSGPWIKYPCDQKYSSKLDYEKRVLNQIIEKIEELGMNKYYQHFDYLIENWLPFYWKGYSQTTRYTYLLDDLSNLEKNYTNLESRTRKNIRKAEKRVIVKEDCTIEKFYQMNKMTFDRQGIPIPYSLATLKKIDEVCLKNNCRKIFYAVDDNNDIHAAIYIVWDENSAYYLMGGSNPKLSNSEAMSLLIWEAIKFASNVTKKFDFEGSMIESIERFFRSFGAIQKPYFAVYKEFKINTLYEIAKLICKNSKHAKKAYRKVKKK